MYKLNVFIGNKGGYGSAGSALGPRYGQGGMKGPMQGKITAYFKSYLYLFIISVGCINFPVQLSLT